MLSILLLQMVKPVCRVWISQNPLLMQLPDQEYCAQPGGSDDTLGSGLVSRLNNTSSCSTLADTVTLGSVQISLSPHCQVVPRPFCEGP